MDDIVYSFWSEFFTIRIRDAEHISSIFDCHDLRSETYSEIRDLLHPGVLCGHDHPLNPTIAESSWNTDSIESVEKFRSFFLDILGFDESESNTFFVCKTCSLEPFIEGIIRIFEPDILTDHTDLEHLCRIIDIRKKLFPLTEVRSYDRKMELIGDLLSECFSVECEGDTVDRVESGR